LRKINESWLALFNPDENLLEYLILNQRPLSLEITADHNKNISEIKFKLKKGTRIWLGELMHGDHSRDTDDDGVPDIFEEEYDPSIVLDLDFDNEDETQNIAHDRSPNHNNGTIYGAKWVDGKVDRALEFDGVDDYVKVLHNTSLNMAKAVTIEAWVHPEEVANYQCIVHKWDGTLSNYHLYVNPNGYAQAGNNDGTGWRVFAGTSVVWKGWHHLVAVLNWDKNWAGIYVDGVLENEDTTCTVGTGENTADVWLGERQDLKEEFKGIIDEVRIYNRALSADEVKERYNLGKLKRVSVPRLVKKMGYAGW